MGNRSSHRERKLEYHESGGVCESARSVAQFARYRCVSLSFQLSKTDLLGIPETVDAMKDAERALHRVLMRNGYWKRQTEKEALILLRYSRPLLMRLKSSPMAASSSRSTSPPLRTVTSLFPFYALPNELKVYILGLLAPSLSPAQRMRIYNYASDPSTLPCLLPSLRRDPGKGCLADPSSLGSSVGFQVIGPNGGGQRCADGKCMGAGNSLLCRREEERNKFFEAMGCCAYEPERKGQD